MARAGGGGRPPHGISRLARLAQPLPLWRVAPAFPHLVVLMVDAGTPPELPPGLREEYLAGMRAQLGLLATIADRLTAAGNDREALAVLQRETHKIHGSAGSYGFAEASRLAAGLEATAKDWVARPDDPEVDRGSLVHWFVGRLAEMLGITVRSEEHTSELQSQSNLVCRLLLEKKKKKEDHGLMHLCDSSCRE